MVCDISESLILAGVLSSFGSGSNAIRRDELTFCGGSMDYPLLKTYGIQQDIVAQMEVDSGYTSAIPTFRWYYDELMRLHSQNITEEFGIK